MRSPNSSRHSLQLPRPPACFSFLWRLNHLLLARSHSRRTQRLVQGQRTAPQATLALTLCPLLTRRNNSFRLLRRLTSSAKPPSTDSSPGAPTILGHQPISPRHTLRTSPRRHSRLRRCRPSPGRKVGESGKPTYLAGWLNGVNRKTSSSSSSIRQVSLHRLEEVVNGGHQVPHPTGRPERRQRRAARCFHSASHRIRSVMGVSGHCWERCWAVYASSGSGEPWRRLR